LPKLLKNEKNVDVFVTQRIMAVKRWWWLWLLVVAVLLGVLLFWLLGQQLGQG